MAKRLKELSEKEELTNICLEAQACQAASDLTSHLPLLNVYKRQGKSSGGASLVEKQRHGDGNQRDENSYQEKSTSGANFEAGR